VTELTPEQAVRVEYADDIAILTIDRPPVNALSASVLAGLKQRLDEALADERVLAAVIFGAGGNFIAGADITRLERIAEGRSPDKIELTAASAGPSLGEILELCESGPKPTVAAIDGFAFGGGFELALACNARVGTPSCRVGLPELELGLIPGAGGTQRLPRLVGVAKAAEMMLSSQRVGGREAAALGILDELAPSNDALIATARRVALEMAGKQRERSVSLRRTDRIEPADQARHLVEAARRAAAKKTRNVRYPEACLDAILAGAVDGPDAGLARERALFEELLSSEAARGLIHVFFATRAASKVPGVTDVGLEPRAIARVGVIGGGTMGSGIATALINAGLDVTLKEANSELGAAARERVRKNVDHQVHKGRLTRQGADETLARLKVESDYGGFGQLDLVIEAATENVELKQEIFFELEAATNARCILATNTSTIDVNLVAAKTGAAGRVLGTHFFSPAHVMKLVEVVRTEQTEAQTLLDVLALAKRIKKTAVTVGNCPGFLVNRIFMRYGQVAGFLIDRGVHPYRIDRALFDFGMPMGPNRMGDLAGLDVSVYAGGIMDSAYPERAYRSALRQLLVEADRFGEKSGRGHYRYEAGRAVEDPELDAFVLRARHAAGDPEPIDPSDDEIVRMALFGVVNEACRALEEKIVRRASDIDVASILGMGFPAYRGGPMKWADGIRARVVRDGLASFHDRFEHALFEPSRRLEELADAGASFFD
jgi:enoyl-CoA hydratase/3-hydroxyacyl-CoA dehydrogenase